MEQSDKHILVKEVKEGVITLTWIWAINPGQPPRGITPVTVCSFKGMTFHIFNKKIKVGTHKA